MHPSKDTDLSRIPLQPRGVGRPRGERPGGFTLVEVLLSMSVLLFVLVFLCQALSHTSRIWSQGEAAKERMQTERVICDFIATELKTALLPIDRSKNNGLQLAVNPATVSGSFANRDCIFWQAPLASDQTLGDVAEIGYFVRWDTTSNAQNPRAQLCRFFASPSSGTAPNTWFQIYSNPTTWISDKIIQAVAPGDKASQYQGLFADNVVGLWIRCLDAYGQQITRDYSGASLQLPGGNYAFDSRRGYTDSRGEKTADYTDASGVRQPLCILPPTIEVNLVLIDATSAIRIGPSEQAAIAALSLTGAGADAGSFVAAAQNSLSLVKVRSGLRPYQMRIALVNAK